MTNHTWPLTDRDGSQTDVMRVDADPCRFCGSEGPLDLHEEGVSRNPVTFQVFCRSCAARGPEVEGPTEAVEMWNGSPAPGSFIVLPSEPHVS